LETIPTLAFSHCENNSIFFLNSHHIHKSSILLSCSLFITNLKISNLTLWVKSNSNLLISDDLGDDLYIGLLLIMKAFQLHPSYIILKNHPY
jgi:hypothetical protein